MNTYLKRIILIALGYFILGKISFAIANENEILTIVIFTAEGLALASSLIYGPKIWIGIFLGQFFLVSTSIPIVDSLALAGLNSLEAIIAILLWKKFNFDTRLSTLKDVIALLSLIVFVLQPFTAIMANLILIDAKIVLGENYLHNIFRWWFGNIMGQILITPLLLLFYANFSRKRREGLELLLISLFFILLTYITQITLSIHNLSILLSITLPLVLYLSSKRPLHYALLATTMIIYISLYFRHIGVGSFIGNNLEEDLINLNFYFLSQIILLLLVGTLFTEKRIHEKNLEEIITVEKEKNKEHTLMLLQQSRLAQMGQVLNMIAHQWRQPLNTLLLLNEVFVLKYHKNEIHTQDVDKFQEDTTLQIKQMSGTIDDFRDFFNPRKEKSKFLVNDVIEHLTLIMQPIFDASNITLEYIDTDNIYIHGYPNEFAQALLNIVYNARDALLEQHIEHKKVTIYLKREKNEMSINICDNAGGVDHEIIKQIFDPYFSTKEDKNGTGLGLYMSKMIVETHMDGKLKVRNSPQGASFNITLKIN